MTSPLVLLAVALLCRLLPAPAKAGWSWRLDLPLMVGMSLCMSWLSADWFARFYLSGPPLSTADFSEYCDAVGSALRGEGQSANPQRSKLVATGVAFLAQQFGIFDGLVLSAILSMAVAAMGLYLWAQAVAGRGAAWVTVLSLGCFAPLVLMTRAPSFYAEMIGAMCLANGLAAQALVRRTPGWILAGALVCGGLTLVELRGVLWTIPTWGLCLLAALGVRGGGWWKRGACVSGVLLALVLDWSAGRWVYPENFGGTFEVQVRTFVVDSYRFVHKGEEDRWTSSLPTCPPDARFNWGWTNPLNFPKTLQCLSALNAAINPDAAGDQMNRRRWETQVEPWIPLMAVAAGISLLGVATRPIRLLALLGPALPSAMSLLTAWNEPENRRLAPAFVLAPILFGVAWTLVSEPRSDGPWFGRPLRVLVVFLFVFGILPSHIGPQADWRVKVGSQGEWKDILVGGGGKPSQWDLQCIEALTTQQKQGINPTGYLIRRWTGP